MLTNDHLDTWESLYSRHDPVDVESDKGQAARIVLQLIAEVRRLNKEAERALEGT